MQAREVIHLFGFRLYHYQCNALRHHEIRNFTIKTLHGQAEGNNCHGFHFKTAAFCLPATGKKSRVGIKTF